MDVDESDLPTIKKGKKVLLAIDGSKHSVDAFECMYLILSFYYIDRSDFTYLFREIMHTDLHFYNYVNLFILFVSKQQYICIFVGSELYLLFYTY